MDFIGFVFFDCVKGYFRDLEKLKNCYFGYSYFLVGNVRKFYLLWRNVFVIFQEMK